MNKLPQKIKLKIQGEEIDFHLTDKREIKYYGRTEDSNESLWRIDSLGHDEVFYQTEWGWGIFAKIEERELSTVRERKKYDKYLDDLIGEYPEHHITLDKRGVPRKVITVTYNNETIESYE